MRGYLGESAYEKQKIQVLREEKRFQEMRCHYSQNVCGPHRNLLYWEQDLKELVVPVN